MKYELWSKDEYGQGTIVGRFTDIDKLIKKAKEEVNNINVDNALSAEEKSKNWEAYFVEIDSDASNTYIYAGNNPDGKHRYYDIKNTEQKCNPVLLTSNLNLKFYLGELDNKTWYASDRSKNIISNINNESLKDKTVYFTRIIP
jgi:hypothetical protein